MGEMSVFFDPEDSFIAWLKKYARGRIIWDVGCGEGALLRRLWKAGVKAIGVEPYPTWDLTPNNLDLIQRILPFKAEECSGLHRAENALILFCRPCHSGFVGKTLGKLHRSSTVLYVSKPENLRLDVPRCYGVRKLKAPGCVEESVWKVLR